MPINTEISGSRLPASTGVNFGSNLLRGLSMLKGGQQGDAQAATQASQFAQTMEFDKTKERNDFDIRDKAMNFQIGQMKLAQEDRNYYQSLFGTSPIGSPPANNYLGPSGQHE